MRKAAKPSWLFRCVLGTTAVLVFAHALVAPAQEWDHRVLERLFKKVQPSVVSITANGNKWSGTGFVADAERGLIVTNYRVIEGTKDATVSFWLAKKGHVTFTAETYPADGFLAVSPGKDLALLHIKDGRKAIQALKLAKKPPAKGEPIYAFAGWMRPGRDFTYRSISVGKAVAICPGRQLDDEITRLGCDARLYGKAFGYDRNAVWLELTLPNQPCAGRPLVNSKEEVVGVVAFSVHGKVQRTDGHAVNFAICSKELSQFIASAGTKVHPFSSLPSPRQRQESALDQRDGKREETRRAGGPEEEKGIVPKSSGKKDNEPEGNGEKNIPKTFEEAILKAIALSVGQHVFDRPYVWKAEQTICYDDVQIRATRLADRSIQVVLSREKPGSTFADVFTVKCSSTKITTTPAGGSSKTNDTATAEERRLCRALQKVLRRYLAKEKKNAFELSITIPMTQQKQKKSSSPTTQREPEIDILVTDLPLVNGHWTLFKVDRTDKIEFERRGH